MDKQLHESYWQGLIDWVEINFNRYEWFPVFIIGDEVVAWELVTIM